MYNKISIIIPTRNEENYISGIISDIKKQTIFPFEIIIVDGKSTDNTIAVAKNYAEVNVLVSDPNVAEQRNIGAHNAQGEILIFFDADTRCHRNFLKNCLDEFTQRKLDIACPLYIPYQSTFFIKIIYGLFNKLFKLGERRCPSGAGPCIMIKKSIFYNDGGFNKHLTFEDIEFIRRYAKRNTFGILQEHVYVSDRRFKEEGEIKLFIKYIYLSYYFMTNQFVEANKIKYTYHYKNNH